MEIVHILAGPVVGIAITALAFSDEFLIKRKVEAFFAARGVSAELAEAIEAMISGGIAFATFLGNIYLAVINSIIAAMVFPFENIKVVLGVSEVITFLLILQAAYIFREYELLDLGEICPVGQITYDRFLRWEQVILNAVTLGYFLIGIASR